MTSRSFDHDVAVLGGGLAGGVAARQLARRGVDVVVLERSRFPRDKPCGGCLNHDALRDLEQLGLADLVASLEMTAIESAVVHARGVRARFSIPTGGAVSRSRLDNALAHACREAGVRWLEGTGASIRSVDHEGVTIDRGADEIRVSVAIDARGLAPSRDGEPVPQRAIAAAARVGLGAVIDDDGTIPPHEIEMVCGDGGYVGMVRGEPGKVIVAAAIDRRRGDATGGLAKIRALAAEARFDLPVGLEHAVWRGTPPLTQTAREVATRRVFSIGDAAGYVEPFTGEGMAWGIATARDVVPWVVGSIERWDDRSIGGWRRARRRLLGYRPFSCRMASRLARHPLLLSKLLQIAAAFPASASPLARMAYRGAGPRTSGRAS